MLTLNQATHHTKWHIVMAIVLGVVALFVSLYVTALYLSPALSLSLYKKPLNLQSVAAPDKAKNRLIIPKIGIDITYSTHLNPAKDNAQWIPTQSDTPKDGNNVVMAAQRFNLAVTPIATIDSSPFYNIDQLVAGDTIFVDYDGLRYAYEVQQSSMYTAAQPDINTSTTTPTLTLYTLGEGQKCYVVTAKKLGQVQM